MTFRIAGALVLLSIVCAATSGCDRGKGDPSASGSKDRVVVVGFTASQTGKFNVESTRQINGLSLWVEQLNAAGGVTLADGTKLKVATKFYDDESNKDRVQELYTKLIGENKADFLVSPYSSGLADAAAVIAEQRGRLMITAGAASDSTHTKGYGLVYQAYTPASRYLTGAFDLLSRVDPKANKVAFVRENDKFSTEVCAAADAYGKSKGFQVALHEGYEPGTADFAPFINKIPSDVDAIMGGGHFADGSTFARQLFEKRVRAKFFSLLVAPPEPKFAELGDAAAGVIGPSQWEPLAHYSAENAKAAGIEWYGPSVADFISAYKAKFSEEPSYHAAGGYVAGLLLQKAVSVAGTLDTQKVKVAMDAINVMTFFGRIQFETDPAKHGLQRSHEMVYIQWRRNGEGKLEKQVVWPPEVKSSDAQYPAR
jgi:ABC-type branched-subunit amino acid transport system substrate-binding protein